MDTLLILLLPLQALAQIPAFPGAQGFASDTPGGRGGCVHIVTTLADDNSPGSLRWALEQTGPRTVVIEVAGVIHLNEPLRIGGRRQAPPPGDNPHSFLTIAGESAPGGGITLSGYPLEFNNDVHDVIVRHIRIRGPRVDDRSGSIGDGLAFFGGHNIIVDHVSLSWFADEGISIESTASRINHDITVEHSFVAEGLLNGNHPSGGPHSRCAIVSDGSFNVSLHHNVFMSCNRRNPNLGGNSNLGASDFPLSDVRHNLIYNAGDKGIQFARGAVTNIIGNWIRQGPQTSASHPMEATDRMQEGTQLYLAGNCELTVSAGTETNICPENQVALVQQTHGPGLVAWLSDPLDTPPVVQMFSLAGELLGDAGAHPSDPADSTFRAQYMLGTGDMGAGEKPLADIEIPEPAPGIYFVWDMETQQVVPFVVAR
ncbi:MAG: hypothetical protein COV99_02010 [Bacteroidetes bacterium CG12_big_fil_rev_8_21_14_0_65_60_17]|nr:MAG: hypothetical protein COV99_02010 [Bacteroidetes bacterium CG12_big_fil_rev_8_21_14_0_65_60_17]